MIGWQREVDERVLQGVVLGVLQHRKQALPLAGLASGHAADGGDSAGCSPGGAPVEVVRHARGSALRQRLGELQVNVHVHAAGHDELAAGVYLPDAGHLAADLGHLFALDAHVGDEGLAHGNDGAASDHQVHGCLLKSLPPRRGKSLP